MEYTMKYNEWNYNPGWCDAFIANSYGQTVAFKVTKTFRVDKDYIELHTVTGGPNADSQEVYLPLDIEAVDFLIERLTKVKQTILDQKK